MHAWLHSWNAARPDGFLLLGSHSGLLMAVSYAEEEFLQQLRLAGLPEPAREFLFAKSIKRRWRADFAYPAMMLLIEIEGGVYSRGRHTRGAGFTKDCQKYNAAALLGFKVLRFTPQMVKSGEALNITELALNKELSDVESDS